METVFAIVLLVAALSFTLSAAAGMGGSLILVPVLCIAFGPKEGVALAAILLATNNIGKLAVYRRDIPVKESLGVVGLTILGALVGARLLVSAPGSAVSVAVLISITLTLVFERGVARNIKPYWAPLMAFLAGMTSGFSGTSGPLKGLALRSLGLERRQLVGAASLVSFCGDTVKAVTFMSAGLFTAESWSVFGLMIPLMPLAVYAGRRINTRIGENGYRALFWTVMAGYAIRLLTTATGTYKLP